MRWSSDWLRVLLAAAGLLLASRLRGPLNVSHERIAKGAEAYALAPPEQMVVLSLGYRAALADLARDAGLLRT